ncbi:unnamed protein product, partial [marine sediment metagenome]
MRRIRCLIVVLTMAMPGLALSEEPVYFADPNLQAAVEKALGVSEPNATDMLDLTVLDANKKGIVDLTGLEYATNLTALRLSKNQISDCNAISALTNLKDLNLGYNQITDISTLSGLTNLTELWLYNNPISDISAISGLTNLKS